VRLRRNARPCITAAAAIAASLIALAGCGGDDDGSSETVATGVQLQTPTAPTAPTSPTAPDERRFGGEDGSTSTTPSAPSEPPPGAQQAQRALAPFRDCVTGQGVDPATLRPGAWRQQDSAEMRKAIEAGINCISELPPGLQEAAERFKRRYEQRTG
jgi:hypothetical protein